GRWYVSLWYTVAETVRRHANAAVPAFGQGVGARGAATPEEAVRQLVDAGVRLDVRRAVELTPPDEAAALHDYAPLFVGKADESARRMRTEGTAITVKALDVHATTHGDRAVATIT